MAPGSEPSSDPAGAARWQLRLLGAMQASDGVQQIDRFPSRAAAALFARLALMPGRTHGREELVELLWPGVELDVGRNRLRQTLSSLKSLLEAGGVPGTAVIHADRASIRVLPGAIDCDALRFERALRAGQSAAAIALYQGELMPGFYDEWIDDERKRLQALRDRLGEPAAAPASAAVPSPAPAAPAARTIEPLPVYLTRLFGAEHAAARLRSLVQSERLVSLLGPGGSGKTRLAVEVGQALRAAQGGPAGARFERVAFVVLVAVADAPGLLAAAARALRLGPGNDTTDALVDALAGERVLLVLDNFEQLVDGAAATVGELLQRLPTLHVLVTSRRALGLDGESCVASEPLAVPPEDCMLRAAATNPSVALFVDRARAARADFHLHEGNVADIVALVRALDGMPLAIELAASRVRSVAPAQMVALLVRAPGAVSRALPLLARSGPRAGHDRRHASMEQVIDWSWRQLQASEQQVLAALTVFHGDAGAAAVAAVVGLADVALSLDELVAHSLVRSNSAADGQARFGLYEPIREFAAARAGSALLAPMRQRLRRWLIDWARSLGPLPQPSRVAPELPEVHAALIGAAADADAASALELALALRRYWNTDALPSACVHALEDALGAADVDAARRSELHELLAYLRFEAGSAADAARHADAALECAGADASRRARALVRRVWVDLAAGRSEGGERRDRERFGSLLDEALAGARACGDHEAQARALHQASILAHHYDGDLVRAEALLEQSQALWLALGDRRQAYARLRNRAQCWVGLGRSADAMAALEACEQAARDDGDWVGLIDNTLSMGVLLSDQRRWAEAQVVIRRAVALCWQRWHHHGLAYALWTPPRILAHLRRPEEAMRLMAFAAAFWTQRFGPLSKSDQRYVRIVRRLVQAQIGGARTEVLALEGAAMSLGAAVSLALQD